VNSSWYPLDTTEEIHLPGSMLDHLLANFAKRPPTGGNSGEGPVPADVLLIGRYGTGLTGAVPSGATRLPSAACLRALALRLL